MHYQLNTVCMQCPTSVLPRVHDDIIFILNDIIIRSCLTCWTHIYRGGLACKTPIHWPHRLDSPARFPTTSLVNQTHTGSD